MIAEQPRGRGVGLVLPSPTAEGWEEAILGSHRTAWGDIGRYPAVSWLSGCGGAAGAARRSAGPAPGSAALAPVLGSSELMLSMTNLFFHNARGEGADKGSDELTRGEAPRVAPLQLRGVLGRLSPNGVCVCTGD